MTTLSEILKDRFLSAYLECALWSSHDVVNGKDVELDEYSLSDLSEEVLANAIKDCTLFRAQNAKDLEEMDPTQAAHDFWLTRNGHGVGFWDRNLGELGERLTKACKSFGEVNLYVGDDGKIYQ